MNTLVTLRRWEILAAIALILAAGAAEQRPGSWLANGDFEQGAAGEVPGWSIAFYPSLPSPGDDIHRCIARSSERARSGRCSVKIDTTPVLGQETDLVFNGQISEAASRQAGQVVLLSGWVYVEPGTALRPIGMRLRAFGRNREGQAVLGSGGWDAERDRFVFGLFTERCGAGGHAQRAFQWPDGAMSPYAAAAAGKPSG